ncbi:TRPM8 channel-associated factor 2 [Crotalus adamanteus]|uniref:TRPM8 channel-associated factor 2 n=1 Tax=Crotalus adamanteus TaxID=8729 RepID=A0AAW1BEH9_CROAD
MLKGMTQLDFSGGYVPCQLQLNGGQAFPLLKTWKEEILIAGCSYGRGKMVVASHESMLPVRAFVRKALAWLQPSPSSPVGFHSTMHSLFTELQGSGLNLVSNRPSWGVHRGVLSRCLRRLAERPNPVFC